MSPEEQRLLVRRGYDAISEAYRGEDYNGEATYEGWVAELADLVPSGGAVLDLGCGNGVPATRALVDRGFRVVGLDHSITQLARARHLVPGAAFVQADMAAFHAPPASFDAVVSFYALIHVPLVDQRALLSRLVSWLRPGGHLLAIVGAGWWTGVEDYLGAPMFWDHADAGAYVTWLGDAGFEVVWDRFVPEGDVGHTLVLARRPGS